MGVCYNLENKYLYIINANISEPAKVGESKFLRFSDLGKNEKNSITFDSWGIKCEKVYIASINSHFYSIFYLVWSQEGLMGSYAKYIVYEF